ncbi:hypothetical protein M501DRAFT_928542, partial [Patellaria atrata CBS 101060]
YIFYSRLADEEKLDSLLGLEEEPVLRQATVRGGFLKQMGEYKGLFDAPMSASVEGFAYWVQSEEHEDRLRDYESAAYKVVKCMTEFGDGSCTKGCTFRWAS